MSSNHPTDPWWKGAVLYQIYPRSFADSNNDGIGDLKGIADKLDYVASLGVDGIWFSPIFQSPQIDFGYDVSDYRAIDPDYGTMADFDRLLTRAHDLGLKVLLDIVPSHTSENHPWFTQSLTSKDNPKADWYVWADPKPDGGPPNNWLSVFGGPAWSYHPARRQYYLHIFYKQQPKLNLHNPETAEAVLDEIKFWLDKGVDGFRVDVINTCLHDPALADNPPTPAQVRTEFHWSHAPHLQSHVGDFDWHGNPAFAQKMRTVFNQYKDRFVLGEVALPPTSLPRYVGPDLLHSGYHFGFLETGKIDPDIVTKIYSFLDTHPEIWPSIAFSNHDFERAVSRLGGETEKANPGLAKFWVMLLLSLRGTVLLYQGEELGLPEAEIAEADRHDPMGKLYPHWTGARVRDGCRTPMPWVTGAPNAGFSTAKPWLPVAKSHGSLAVDHQETDDGSVLHFTRALIRLRRENAALRCGSIEIAGTIDSTGLLVFQRRAEDGLSVLCVFNFSGETHTHKMGLGQARLIAQTGSVTLEADKLCLGPKSGCWFIETQTAS